MTRATSNWHGLVHLVVPPVMIALASTFWLFACTHSSKIKPALDQNAATAAVQPGAKSFDKAELARMATVWNEHPNYSQTDVSVLSSSTSFAKRVSLTVVVLKNSLWKMEEVVERIRRTEEIFGVNCQVSFSPILLVSTVHAMGAFPSAKGNNADVYLDVGKMLFNDAATKPIIFMADGQDLNDYFADGQPLYLSEKKFGGVAYRAGRNNVSNRQRNGAIIFRTDAMNFGSSYPISMPMTRGFSEVMAHELGHILFDQGHIYSADNLMSEFGERTNQIDQCDRIEDNGFLK